MLQTSLQKYYKCVKKAKLISVGPSTHLDNEYMIDHFNPSFVSPCKN